MKRFIVLILIIMLIMLSSSTVFADGNTNIALMKFQQTVDKYGDVLMGFALSTSVLIFLIHFIRLANSYDHPFMRRQVQRDIFITGIAVAMIGAIGVIGKIVAATALYTP